MARPVGPFGGRPPGMFGKVEKAKDTRGTLLRLWSYLRRQSWTLVAIVLLVVLTTVARPAGPLPDGPGHRHLSSAAATWPGWRDCWLP